MQRSAFGSIVAIVLAAIVCANDGSAASFGPSPYLGSADSPFSGVAFSYFQLEDFEDGALDEPGVSASTGQVLAPGALTDSVDADDGAIDGFGTGGRSWYVAQTSITFTFDALALGALPTHVGIVWTDVGTAPILGFGSVTFESFDENGNLLHTVGPVTLGDGLLGGQTAEDRFFGAFHAGGLSAIRITMNSDDWEIDHLQYGRVVPEPGTLSLVGLSLLLVGAGRRRR